MASLQMNMQMGSQWVAGAQTERATGMRADDGTLVAMVLRGDQDAFAELSSRHRPRVARMIRAKVRSREDAQDIEQDVFVKAYTSLRRLSKPGRFGPWVNMIARNACTDYLRRRARDRSLSVDEPLDIDGDGLQREFPDERTEPCQVVQLQAFKQAYDGAVETLTEPCRSAFLLREEEGLSMEEIAKRTEGTVGGVKSLIYRARRKLETTLSPHIAA